ncbi:MAG: type II secretion system protein [Candidatus Omnitrophota bacterium]
MSCFKQKKGFTIIEVVVTISIIGILAGAGTWILVFFAENVFSLPNNLNINMTVSDTLEIICEGDETSGGLRFSKEVLASAPNQVIFIDQADNAVEIKLLSNKVWREVNTAGFQKVPYYIPDSLNINETGIEMFEYYDEYGNITGIASEVKRVQIHITADMGDLESEIKTSVYLRGK